MRKYWVKEITEAGQQKIDKSGEENVDGMEGREEAMGEVIVRAGETLS